MRKKYYNFFQAKSIQYPEYLEVFLKIWGQA